ncbi:hypothetical protein Bca4012_101322 [Brassica carinata]
MRLRLLQCFEKIVFVWLSDAASERRVLRLIPIKPADKTRGCDVNYAVNNADLTLSHLHLRHRPRALSSPSHTATSSLISISIFDVDLELSHLHLRRRPRALSSLTQHELSLLLRFGFQAYYWKEVLEERRKINWCLQNLVARVMHLVDWWAGVKDSFCLLL